MPDRSRIANRLALSVGIMVFVLAGCGGEAPSTEPEAASSTSTTPAATAGSEESGAGSITVLHSSEPRSLNPIEDLVKTTLMISATMIEPLLQTNEDFEPVPNLAESWERVDETTWRFTLREGVEFTNGEPFNAEAVVFSILTVRDTPGTLSGYFSIIDGATAVSEYEVEVETTVPTSAIPALMTFQWILPPDYYEDVGVEAFGQSPIGTGPFVFESWTPGQSVSVSRNDAYWGTPPNLSSIVWQWTPEAQSRLAQLQSGGADLILDLPPNLVEEAEAADGVRVESVRSTRTAYLEMNINDAPLDDVRVRRAIWHAIDREAIVNQIFEGRATLTRTIQPFVFPSSSEHEGEPTYDPDAARELLSEVGSIDTIPLHYPAGRYPLGDEVVEAIAGMLTDVGLPVQLDPMDTGAFFDLALSGDMDGLSWATNAPLYPHEDQLMRAHFRTDIAQFQYCNDPELDVQIDQALTLADDEERSEAYNRIEEAVVTELLCFMPLYDQTSFYGVADRLTGLTFRPDEYVQYTEASVTSP